MANGLLRISQARSGELIMVERHIKETLGLKDQALALALDDYRKNVSAADLHMFLFSRLSRPWIEKHVRFEGQEILTQALAHKGLALVLSVHHHHSIFTGAVLGLWGYPTRHVAMDPTLSPLYLRFQKLSDRYYGESEACLGGGKYIYVRPEGKSSAGELAEALASPGLVLSLHDFPSDFSPKRQVKVDFFGRKLSFPFGTVILAEKMKTPMVIACLEKEDSGFCLRFSPVRWQEGRDAIIQDYGDALKSLVLRRPGMWEGWKWDRFFGHG